jgi:2-methylisocitrate lyase-like PEP mutase family enzyme
VSELEARCDLLRSLHVPGDPLVLPNAWDAGSAQAVVAAGFPVVATTSSGVARALGFEDEERAPAAEMLAAAARIAHAVDVPVTVDAESGYGMEPAELVEALRDAGAAGCNLEETNHASGSLREPEEQAGRLTAVREAASAAGYGLVINARIDVFLADGDHDVLVPDALRRARAYRDAGADCVYPIGLAAPAPLTAFMSESDGAVNILAGPEEDGRVAELAGIGVARISFGGHLHRRAMEQFGSSLSVLVERRNG